VNSNSERGLLSMALDPAFPATPLAYIRWTESSTGADSGAVADVPLLGNRVDRYIWNGSTLTFDRPIIAMRSRQSDNLAVPGHPGTNNGAENGNHNGGVIKFGPDGKLYVFMGDQGRRGQLQNLPEGPFLTIPQGDDTFGGPQPDNAHLSGVILRLETDGSAPTTNPFFAAGAAMGGEVGANIQKIFSYGHRNGFGMAFDPITGNFWVTENADDAYSELNRVIPGMNGGWIQLMGPAQPDARLEVHRNHHVRLRTPAGAVSADARRLQCCPCSVEIVHAAGCDLCGSRTSAGGTKSAPLGRPSYQAMP
jgi:hypothetical protein